MSKFIKNTSIKLIILIALSLLNLSTYAQTSGDCIIMQSATNGTLQKNSTSYQLTLSKTDPLLVYFKHIPNKHLQSTKFLTKSQFYNQVQQSLTTDKNHPFTAEIIALKPDRTTAHYYITINKVRYNNHNSQISYLLNQPNSNYSLLPAKIKLKHVVMLINGDDICINCGGPW